MKKLYRRLTDNATLKSLGPGLITGAADDDPSGIATYSQAGAQFGFNTLWTLVLTYPFMVGIQLVSARIGRVTGRGLAANIRRAYSPWLLYAIVALLLVANVINIAADIAAMGEALRLVTGVGSQHMYSLGFGILCLAAAGLPALQHLRALPEVADARPAGLCRHRLRRAHALDRGRWRAPCGRTSASPRSRWP
jgi:hypothetical protein